MYHKKQVSQWENCHKYYLFFTMFGYFFILLGFAVSLTGTMGFLKGSGIVFFLIAQLGFFVTLLGNNFVFKYIANLWKYRIAREMIPIKTTNLEDAIHHSIEKINVQETEIEQQDDPKYRIIALTNGIKIKVLVHPKASFGFVSIYPYKKETKEFVDKLTRIIDEEIERFTQEDGVPERTV